MKSCAFFGGDDLKFNKYAEEMLLRECENLASKGYGVFYFGGLGKFDRACYQAITRVKDINGDIKRIYCRLYDKPRKIKKGYEDSVYFPTKSDAWYTRVFYRDYQTLLRADLAVFCFNPAEPLGGEEVLFRLANKLAKPHLNVYDNLYGKSK